MVDARILVVEDDAGQRSLVADILRGASYRVGEAADVESAVKELQRVPVDLVLSDWKLPGRDGMQLLADLRASEADTAFVMVTAYGTIAHALEAVRAGADDYLPKPFERQALLLAVERTLRTRALAGENRRLAQALTERDRLEVLIGKAPSMQRVYRQVEKIAGTDATVLITGESGTGKELAARTLHSLSPRAQGPFVAVNCAAIPDGLLESEFFGALKGAYSGADRSRKGRFEAAAGGTLFLDEIAELPLELQPKLLRVLQEKVITPVGGTSEVPVDVRILSATNRELEVEVAEGRLREDLYYRLNVVPVHMPALRERREDLPQLVEHFIDQMVRRHGRERPSFSAAIMRRLYDHSWPGNVRELGNTIERLVLLAEEDQVSADDLPGNFDTRGAAASGGFRVPPEGLSWDDHERDVLRQALDHCRGNRTLAAKLLGMPYKAFLYRLEKHGLRQPNAG